MGLMLFSILFCVLRSLLPVTIENEGHWPKFSGEDQMFLEHILRALKFGRLCRQHRWAEIETNIKTLSLVG